MSHKRARPHKKRIVRGNNAPFVSNELRKEIRYRSRLKNIARKTNSASAKNAYRKQRNKCTKIKRNNMKSCFHKIVKNGGKQFWQSISPFITNKGTHGNEEFILEEKGKIIKDPREISEIFNKYYINIVEKTTGNPPISVPLLNSGDLVDNILNYYESHTSIVSIKNKHNGKSLKIPLATEDQIYDIINSLDTKKATGIDNIPAKVIKLSAKEIKSPLTKIINMSIEKCIFPDLMKLGKVIPIYKNSKKGNRLDKQYYRPVSILPVLSKIFEKYILNSMLGYVNSILSDQISAYRKGYSCQHVLLKLTEEWRKHLDRNKEVGAVLIDLSKAFDCLPHELLIAKMSAYGFNKETLKFIYSYLNGRKQAVNIKGNLSKFLDILAGVPQGSILGPILFNIFLNDITEIFQNCNLRNFADDNTISGSAKTTDELVAYLENDANKAVDWITANNMIANASKFQAIIVKKNKQDTSGIKLNIRGTSIETSKEVNLLGITIDYKLSLSIHISEICRKAGNTLNGIKRLHNYFSQKERKILVKTYVLSYFNYCPLVWHFCGKGDLHKMEKLQERAIRFVTEDYTSEYANILKTLGESTLYLKRVRLIAQEVYKSINGQSPEYIKELLKSRHANHPLRGDERPMQLYVPRVNQITFGQRSYTYEAPTLWNSLPIEYRQAENYILFRNLIKRWDGPLCRCNICKYNDYRGNDEESGTDSS